MFYMIHRGRRMTTNARNWQNRKKLSKTKYFDCSDVVNCPPKHSEFSLSRHMFGCGNWWKLCHKFEKYVTVLTITRFKPVVYDGCKMTGSLHYLYWKTELFDCIYFKQFNFKFYDSEKNCCVYKECKFLLIESCLFLEVSQKVEKKTTMLSIASLHIMWEKKCKNAFLKFKSIANNRQF